MSVDPATSRGRVLIAYLMLTSTALFWAGNTIVGRKVIDDIRRLVSHSGGLSVPSC